jgi:hypothetical protein
MWENCVSEMKTYCSGMNRGNGNGNDTPVKLLKWRLVMGNVGSVASREPSEEK